MLSLLFKQCNILQRVINLLLLFFCNLYCIIILLFLLLRDKYCIAGVGETE